MVCAQRLCKGYIGCIFGLWKAALPRGQARGRDAERSSDEYGVAGLRAAPEEEILFLDRSGDGNVDDERPRRTHHVASDEGGAVSGGGRDQPLCDSLDGSLGRVS